MGFLRFLSVFLVLSVCGYLFHYVGEKDRIASPPPPLVEEPNFAKVGFSLAGDGYVYDFANVLKADEKKYIEKLCRCFRRQEGVAVKLVVVGDIRKDGGLLPTDAYVSDKDYVSALFAGWRRDRKAVDRGNVVCVFLLGKNDVIVQGDMLMNRILHRERKRRILDGKVLPFLRMGKPYPAVLVMLREIIMDINPCFVCAKER